MHFSASATGEGSQDRLRSTHEPRHHCWIPQSTPNLLISTRPILKFRKVRNGSDTLWDRRMRARPAPFRRRSPLYPVTRAGPHDPCQNGRAPQALSVKRRDTQSGISNAWPFPPPMTKGQRQIGCTWQTTFHRGRKTSEARRGRQVFFYLFLSKRKKFSLSAVKLARHHKLPYDETSDLKKSTAKRDETKMK